MGDQMTHGHPTRGSSWIGDLAPITLLSSQQNFEALMKLSDLDAIGAWSGENVHRPFDHRRTAMGQIDAFAKAQPRKQESEKRQRQETECGSRRSLLRSARSASVPQPAKAPPARGQNQKGGHRKKGAQADPGKELLMESLGKFDPVGDLFDHQLGFGELKALAGLLKSGLQGEHPTKIREGPPEILSLRIAEGEIGRCRSVSRLFFQSLKEKLLGFDWLGLFESLEPLRESLAERGVLGRQDGGAG